MKIYDFGHPSPALDELPRTLPMAGMLVVCRAGEVAGLSEVFGWDPDTAAECLNLDETVRYAGYDSYDFTSLVHIEVVDESIVQREINLFAATQYLVVVLPDQPGARLEKVEEALCRAAEGPDTKPGRLMRLEYLVLCRLAADYSDTLETLEDELEALAGLVTRDIEHCRIEQISRLRKAAYTAKKILRATSYIGDEILMDENGLLQKTQQRYFRNIATRWKKMYDFADSLYDFSGEVLNLYDSKMGIKMNETVNKLTVITLFFGPLTVITGIYGMNFRNMPELNWWIGYPLSLGLMAGIILVIYLVMKKKKWL